MDVGKPRPVATGASDETDDEHAGFTAFFDIAEPRLRRALVGRYGHERGREAAAEALAWGFENWHELRAMTNPIGYLYRVGTSRTRVRRRQLRFAAAPAEPADAPGFEPALAAALGSLSPNQRVAVVLLAGYGCTFVEVAELTELSISTVNTHYRRGVAKLRARLGVTLS